MRLLAWNIRQGGGFRLPRIADALKRHDADIVVLSEYRGGPSAPRLVTALHALGYRHATTFVPPPSRNGVLVAARRPFRKHGAVDVGSPEPYRIINVDFATFRLLGTWRTFTIGDLRVRLVECSAVYTADHWCDLGQVLYVVEGELDTELRDGRTFRLRPGMSYQVSDRGGAAHRSSTQTGAKLFIVD